MIENDGDYRDDLNQHLEFAKIARLNGETFRSGDRTQAADQELTPNYDDRHPRRYQLGIELHQGDKSSGDKKLVGQRIKQDPHRSYLTTSSRQVTIDAICNGGADKNEGRQDFLFAVQAGKPATLQYPHQQWNAEYTCQRYVVGQVHSGIRAFST